MGKGVELQTETIIVALAIDDAALADRVAALLADVQGFRLAAPGEPGDVTVTDTAARAEPIDGDLILTASEAEVMILLAEGASNKEIARRLGISVHTAKFHVGRILDKLDATGRTNAVAHAARLGVIHL